MPRAKPEAPLIVRSVRLSEEGWKYFDKIGGAQWLRNQMRLRALLERNVKAAIVAKTPHRSIAKEHHISTNTIQNIWRGLL